MPCCPFLGEGSAAKIDYMGTLILTSPLEDLVMTHMGVGGNWIHGLKP